MNKYTLRFKNHELEKLYKQEQLSMMKNQFRLNQLMYCLGVVSFIFHGLIVTESGRYILFHIFMLLVGVVNCFVGQKISKAIPVLNQIQIMILSLLQLYYFPKLNELANGRNTFTHDPQESYLAGSLMTILQISMIQGPDFMENILQISQICVTRSLLSYFFTINVFTLLYPFGIVSLIFYHYQYQLNCRKIFLKIRYDQKQDFLWEHGIDECLLSCISNMEQQKIEFRNINKISRSTFGISGQKSFLQFIRNCFVDNVTLETWLWRRSLQILQYDSNLSYQIEHLNIIYKGTEEIKQFELKVLSSFINCCEFQLVFQPIQIREDQKINQEMLTKLQHRLVQQNALLIRFTQSLNRFPLSIKQERQLQRIKLKSLSNIRYFTFTNLQQKSLIDFQYFRIAHLAKIVCKVTNLLALDFKLFCSSTQIEKQIILSMRYFLMIHIIIINLVRKTKTKVFSIKFRNLDHEITSTFSVSYHFLVQDRQLETFMIQNRKIEFEILRIMNIVYRGSQDAYFLTKFDNHHQQLHKIVVGFPQIIQNK